MATGGRGFAAGRPLPRGAVLAGRSSRPEPDGLAVNVSGRFAVNSSAANAVMVREGLGIALCPLYQVQETLEGGALERLLSDYETTVSGVYALYPYNRYLTARVRALIDHLAAALEGLIPRDRD